MTLDCVKPTHTDHTLQCWSEVFFSILPKCLFVIIVMNAYFIDISQGSVETHFWCGGMCNKHVIANCPQCASEKNFENRSIIGEDMDKSKVPCFLPTLYFPYVFFTLFCLLSDPIH